MEDPQVWQTLVAMGPVGLPAYARLRFLPDPAYPGQGENDAAGSAVEASETELLRRAVDVLAAFTTTPQQCYFLLWDGWGITPLHEDSGSTPGPGGGGDWRRGDGELQLEQPPSGFQPGLQARREQRSPRLQAPVVRLPHRDYYLFQGAAGDLGDWGPALPLRASEDAPVPAFVWPGDHAWCLTRDVDPHYAGIGAPQAAIDALMRHPRPRRRPRRPGPAATALPVTPRRSGRGQHPDMTR